MKYKCPKCGKIVTRKSDKYWIKSFCQKLGIYTRLTKFVPTKTDKTMKVETIYQNKWCRIITRDGFYILQSKQDKYNDQYFRTVDECYQKTGLPPIKPL